MPAPISSRLHTPLTEETRNIINAEAIARMKKGVRIVNCARGGLVVEADLKAALESGQVAGAALDVFAVEPAKESIAVRPATQVVATPHLGASTVEAQENVALQVAEQMADFLLTGAVVNALNMPSVYGRGGAAAEALHEARRAARQLRRASSSRRRLKAVIDRPTTAMPPSSTPSR